MLDILSLSTFEQWCSCILRHVWQEVKLGMKSYLLLSLNSQIWIRVSDVFQQSLRKVKRNVSLSRLKGKVSTYVILFTDPRLYVMTSCERKIIKSNICCLHFSKRKFSSLLTNVMLQVANVWVFEGKKCLFSEMWVMTV